MLQQPPTHRLGVRAYARWRSERFGPVSHAAVRKAIDSGRIAAAYDADQPMDRRIDVAMADALWSANTNPAQQRPRTAPAPAELDDGARQRGLFGDAAQDQPPRDDGRDPPPVDYKRASMLRELFRARLLELEYRKRCGELVPVADVRREQFEIGRRIRDRMNGLPDRLPGLTPQDRDALRREIREALEELARALRS